MGKLFNLDSPIMRVLGRIADVLWINFLTVVCCIPIITAGAAFTAMHYSVLKLVRDEECYVTKDFFKSFKENFKQATILWLIVIVFALLMILDFYYMFQMSDGGTFTGIPVLLVFSGLCVVSIFGLCTITFLFPIQSHFGNSIKGTLRNSFMMSVLVLPKTILMLIIMAMPVILLLLVEYFPAFSSVIPITLLFWFSGPAYFCALLYNKTFKRFEPEKEEVNDDFTWTVGGAEGDAEPAKETEPAEAEKAAELEKEEGKGSSEE